jgi:glutamyl-tRNA synthetase
VPVSARIAFQDGRCGEVAYVAGRDFGDFVAWRHDGTPSYQIACAVDDHAMAVTEVVRGEDLLLSTARQLLIYRALGWTPPHFHHAALWCDAAGERLAKRHDSMSLRQLRAESRTPESLRAMPEFTNGAESGLDRTGAISHNARA